MSTAHPHLFRRISTYHWRRRLPPPLARLLERSHLALSLRTDKHDEACRLARRLSVAVDRLADQIAAVPPGIAPSRTQIHSALQTAYAEILRGSGDRLGKARTDSRTGDGIDGPLAEPVNGGAGNHLDAAAASAGRGDGGILRQIEDSRTAAALRSARYCGRGTPIPALNIKSDDGPIESDELRMIAHRSLSQRTLAAAAPLTASDRIARELNAFAARRIEEVGREFIRRHARQHARAAKTERDWHLSLRYFVELIGNLQFSEITEMDVDRFRQKLAEVPALFGKGTYAGLSALEATKKLVRLQAELTPVRSGRALQTRRDDGLIGEARALRLTATLKMKTVNKHLSFFTTLWKSRGVPMPLRKNNPFVGSLYTKRELMAERASGGVRSGYTAAELQRLFQSPVWRGCASLTRRAQPGTFIYPDARFWCPLIALLAGMRREEICQLKGDDFDWYGDIFFVRIQPTEGRRVKSASSMRDIPIHSELIRIGLPEFVAYRRSGFLFPELVPTRFAGVRGDSLGKWFHRYRRSAVVGLCRQETDFHSFRRTFTQMLRAAGVPLDHIKPITGHQETDMTLLHYAPAFSLQQKLEVIEKLSAGMSFERLFSHLYGRMPELVQRLSDAAATSTPNAAGRHNGRKPAACPPAAGSLSRDTLAGQPPTRRT